MKIRNGFVTNSSSTSFILSMKNDFTKKEFMTAIGADGDSPFNKVFAELFDAISNDVQDILDLVDGKEETAVHDYLVGDYSEETIAKVYEFIKQGRKVYFGRLKSDGETAAEQYFCCESFIFCDDEIYFNGNIGGW